MVEVKVNGVSLSKITDEVLLTKLVTILKFLLISSYFKTVQHIIINNSTDQSLLAETTHLHPTLSLIFLSFVVV